jgi:hypothetical protein
MKSYEEFLDIEDREQLHYLMAWSVLQEMKKEQRQACWAKRWKQAKFWLRLTGDSLLVVGLCAVWYAIVWLLFAL